MLFDDYVLRQIQKIGELIAAVAAKASGRVIEDVDAELAEAYRALLGMEPLEPQHIGRDRAERRCRGHDRTLARHAASRAGRRVRRPSVRRAGRRAVPAARRLR